MILILYIKTFLNEMGVRHITENVQYHYMKSLTKWRSFLYNIYVDA